ncbi:MAG TPA: AraC family transcriptional regulator, partial [Burkholderiaceae bacterium]|nr:AraC family transcriptional regulator [Burkholderiaceae bacterium]
DTGMASKHAHHAIQISLAMRGCFAIGEGDGIWHQHAGAIVMPHRPHEFDGQGSDTAMVFVEPETAIGRALLVRFGMQAVTPLTADMAEAMVGALREGFDGGADDIALIADSRRAVAMLAEASPSASGVDPRIERALEWMRARLQSPISLAEVAAEAHLSASRFRHLFVAQTGVSFRGYLLWARVGSAIGAGMAGRSWTAAAQEAGFADSAHLSRTCRRMFGIAPAMLARPNTTGTRPAHVPCGAHRSADVGEDEGRGLWSG